jgi:hypothetical protein
LFAYRLALAMGEANVDAMLARISAGQYMEWRAYYEVEPWGGERMDAAFARLQSQIHNMMRRKGPSVKASQFMPEYGPRESQTQDSMVAILSAAAQAAKMFKGGGR